jgi:hypothetical protein
MGIFEKPEREIPSQLRFRPIPVGDWIDMEFVLQEVEQELRGEILAAGLETMANVHLSLAEGAKKVANIIRAGAAKNE